MNTEQAKILVQKYNQGVISLEEESLLEKYIELGMVSLEDLEDISHLSNQLDQVFVQQVQENIRADFYTMLEAEKGKVDKIPFRKIRFFWENLFYPNPGLSMAYTLGLLIIGLGLGLWLKNGNNKEIAQLSSQLNDMQEMVMLTMLEQKSTGERLKAVNLTQRMDKVSEKVANALLHTLNKDENINVRLSALDALYQYASNPTVREGLVQSISQQESPLVLVALAEVMVALQEKRSVRELEELLQKESLPGAIKEKIKNSIEVLI